MSHELTVDGKFLTALREVDAACAQRVRRAGCPHCGGVLDRADYPRKPRGDLGEPYPDFERRRSLCCRSEGCRRRATPPSLLFLGPKVYVGVLVIVASIAGRARELLGDDRGRSVHGVPARTVRRWLLWWRTVFALGAFWKEARGFFAVPVDVGELPGSLVERFAGTAEKTLARTLAFLAPLTTTSVRARIAMVE